MVVGGYVEVEPDMFLRMDDEGILKTEKLFDLFPPGCTMKKNRKVEGNWLFSPDEGIIRTRAVKNKDTIGDVRISYYIPS